MKTLSILGSTGSIGRSTVQIVERFPDRFNVGALTARASVELLADQIHRLKPRLAVVFDETAADQLRRRLSTDDISVDIMVGPEGYRTAATLAETDMVVGAMVGAAGLAPTLAAIDAGKDIALANKETLVMAGEIVMERVARAGVRLLPVDSEHSAIFQCLQGNRPQDVDKILLTASGGPFRNTGQEDFATITPADALQHPNWQMGRKITIDSATLMNKGLEVIEAKWLFDLTPDQIQVVVHPQSIVHSMVAYQDGSVMAQMGIPDMQVAIAYALSWPRRLALRQPLPAFADSADLTFESPDLGRFPCLGLAFDACRTGGTLPAVMNAANEVAVAAFLDHRLSFVGIGRAVKAVMDIHDTVPDAQLEDIMDADTWARGATGDWIVHHPLDI